MQTTNSQSPTDVRFAHFRYLIEGFRFRPIFIAIFFIFTSCQSPAPQKSPKVFKHNETVVRHLDHLDAQRFAHPAVHADDWLIETPIGTLVIAGNHDQHSRHHAPGSIAGIIQNGQFSDNLSAVLHVASSQTSESAWQTTTLHPKNSNGELGLAITQVSADSRFVMRSFISYASSTKSFKWWSNLQNISRTAIEGATIGSTVYWDGGFVFAPGLGFIEETKNAATPWLAMTNDGVTSAMVLRDHPYQAGFLFDPHGPYQNDLIIKTVSLAPKEKVNFEQHVLIAQGGLDKIAPHAWKIAQIPFGTISGNVTPMQSWGEIEIGPNGTPPVLVAHVNKDGSYSAAVPFNDYNVSLVTPGGRRKKPAKISAKKDTASIDFSTVKPGVLHYHVSDPSLLPIAARIVFRGVHPTATPKLGPRHKASGAENILYTATGAGSVELAAGTYRVLFTHGPEFSIDEKEIVLREGRHVSTNAELHATIDRNGWLAADLHLHAEPSYDSSVSLTDRVVSLYAENVDIAVATDHNAVTSYSHAVSALNIKQSLFTVSGVEVTTNTPKWGHFNVWPWPTTSEPPPWTKQTAHQLFEFVRNQQPSAVIQVNHPRMDYHNIGYFTLAGLNLEENRFSEEGASFNFDAIEVFNGMDLKNPELVSKNISEWFELLNLGHRFTATGNSDSHFLAGHFAGYPRNYLQIRSDKPGEQRDAEFSVEDSEEKTEMPQTAFTIEDVAHSVKQGHAFVSNGPFFEAAIDGATFGDELAVKKGAKKSLSIQIQSSPWLPVETAEVIVNGEALHKETIHYNKDGTISDMAFDLRFATDSWVVVKVSGSASMNAVLPGSNATPLAISNPIWIKIQ